MHVYVCFSFFSHVQQNQKKSFRFSFYFHYILFIHTHTRIQAGFCIFFLYFSYLILSLVQWLSKVCCSCALLCCVCLFSFFFSLSTYNTLLLLFHHFFSCQYNQYIYIYMFFITRIYIYIVAPSEYSFYIFFCAPITNFFFHNK